MAAVDSFYLLYREIARSCNCYMEALALVGAWYTARKSITVICDFYSLIRLHFIPRLGSRPDLIKQYGRWAVISGATDGIGKAYAEELASRGLNMILIGQEEEKLQAVAKHIADTYRVETVVMVADFSRGREIYAPIREALRDRDIGILVNDMDAFYPYPQYFTQIPEDTLWDIVNVNIAAASLMVHIVLPGMVERKKGAIVTVSSGSCCKPTPQLAAFSASKVRLFFLQCPDAGSAHAGRGRAGHARPPLLSHLSGVVSRDLRVNIPPKWRVKACWPRRRRFPRPADLEPEENADRLTEWLLGHPR